ncbi:helix-turn-helix domain-containing protein [Bosea sp. BIWAKO-01]|uniref:helix-turn-helix domain-containing protein n=1 Tax=Bosea sp. BIWAKO-01 TaxID=506668 RepID=UPI000942BE70
MSDEAPFQPSGPLGRIYSLQEAAEYLRVSKQAVARAAKKHGIGARFGRDLRFNEADVQQMWEAMRCQPNETGLQTAISRRGATGPTRA